MSARKMMLMLALGFALITLPVPARSKEIVSLQYPAGFQPASLKIWPSNGIYALSVSSKARLIVFNLNGDAIHDIDLLRNRPIEATYWFFDFTVDRNGEIFALAVWRNEQAIKKEIHSGVFVYSKDATFREVVEFTKHVDGRRIVVDDRENIIVSGLMSDFYFGKSDTIHLLHKYCRHGKYMVSFFELDWRNYVQPGKSNTGAIYHNLRPMVDYLPIGIHPLRGIFAVEPGSSRIRFYDPATLQRSGQIELQPPPLQISTLTGNVQRETRIWKVQVESHSVVAEFRQTAAIPSMRQSQLRMYTYKDDGGLPEEIEPASRENGSLIPTVGASGDERLFVFSTSQGAPRVRSIR